MLEKQETPRVPLMSPSENRWDEHPCGIPSPGAAARRPVRAPRVFPAHGTRSRDAHTGELSGQQREPGRSGTFK